MKILKRTLKTSCHNVIVCTIDPNPNPNTPENPEPPSPNPPKS